MHVVAKPPRRWEQQNHIFLPSARMVMLNVLLIVSNYKSYTKLLHYIPFDVAVLLGEVEAYADDLLAVELEGERVVAVFYLL